MNGKKKRKKIALNFFLKPCTHFAVAAMRRPITFVELNQRPFELETIPR